METRLAILDDFVMTPNGVQAKVINVTGDIVTVKERTVEQVVTTYRQKEIFVQRVASWPMSFERRKRFR